MNNAVGVFGSVLGQPKDPAKCNIQLSTLMAKPNASRLHKLAVELNEDAFSITIICLLSLAIFKNLMSAENVRRWKIVLIRTAGVNPVAVRDLKRRSECNFFGLRPHHCQGGETM